MSQPSQRLCPNSACAFLSLLLIRPIGSRRPPDVFVMEPTDAWHLHHCLERKVSARLVVVRKVASEGAAGDGERARRGRRGRGAERWAR